MDGDPAGGTELILKFKLQLIDALCGDADFVLQHCHSLCLLSQRQYDCVKNETVPSEKVRDILDFIMMKDRKCVQSFLNLLQESEMQKTFPKLAFLKELPPDRPQTAEKERTKRKEELAAEEVPLKQPRKENSEPTKSKSSFSRPRLSLGGRMVTEKQLMLVARHIGRGWKEVGRVVLEISSTRMEQILEENPRNHRECVFAMLRDWSMREREKATAPRLHSLLTQEECAVVPGSIDFLLEED